MQHILIVEDEAAIADTIEYALSTEGFQSTWVTTAAKAEELLLQHPFAAAIFDVGLPDKSGFELLKSIRSHTRIPVIFLTARNDEIDRVVGLEIGADDYVTKPFSPRELVTRIKVILRRTGSGENEHQGNFYHDQSRAEISFNQSPLQLTKAEYLLLVTMLNQPGRVYSRSQLMERIWDQNHPSDERTIDTHIKTLRAKIRELDDTEYIMTHRGMGYSLKI